MAWRFKASKYKNAAPIVPKPEACIRDISVGSYQTYGNNIACSAAFMAFNVDHNGSSLAVLPVDDRGRKSKGMPLLHAHSDTVTDMDFSPFHDGLLATGSQDCLVKVWHIPEGGLQESLSTAECTFSHKQRRVETVCFHPTADCLLTTSSYSTVTLWDVSSEKELYSSGAQHGDVVQAVSWRGDGSVLASCCKDRVVRVLDPRLPGCTHAAPGHQSIKDSRVAWLGDSTRILTTGFDSGRQREVFIRDLRNFQACEKTLTLDSSTGILMPLYDPDTGMLFLAGKGDTTISYLEVTEREPHLVEGLRHSGEQTKGACLVPKRALCVMQGEVNRVLQLASHCVVPITYQVPRKTYRDFHADLFPDTAGTEPQLSASQWYSGLNTAVPRISLDPTKRHGQPSLQPRLGPKPFTPPKLSFGADGDVKEMTKFCFDKVFSVPPVPGQDASCTARRGSFTAGGDKPSPRDLEANDVEPRDETESIAAQQRREANLDDAQPHDHPVMNDVQPRGGADVNDAQLQSETDVKDDRRESDASMNDADQECDASMNDARQECDTGASEAQPPSDPDASVEEASEDSEQVAMQRMSIAERRRLYESRSVSAQDCAAPNTSPPRLRRHDSFKSARSPVTEVEPDGPEAVPTVTPKRISTVFGRVSKFRHLKGTPLHKSTHIENIRNVSRQIPGECDGFHANPRRVAVPLSGPGGKIAVLELSRPGKLPDGVIPTLVHGANIVDFAWDPFDCSRLAVACDDGAIRLWTVPEGGLPAPTNTPDCLLAGHSEKIYFIKFHPLASDVLASGSYDMTVRVWDLGARSERLCLRGHTDQMFSLAWSPCGVYCATACKDGKLRVYKPRASPQPVREGKGPVGSRGARLVWALDGAFIVVVGFDKVSERQIHVYRADSLAAPLNTVGLDVSPAILVPFYDEDSSTLFLTGKGDSTIYTFEVTEEAPYLCPLSHHRCATLHQGLSFLPKNVCDVGAVEFARALRLSNATIQPLSFAVPRVKSDLFQDDLFPPTKVTWQPCLSSAEWFSGLDRQPPRVSLKPRAMESLSEASPQRAPSVPERGPWCADVPGSVKEKQEQIQRAVSRRMELNLKLEQDDMEGVDDKEWEE
ncbi:coronin-7 [Bacillus rossius redtenbacheri]|uniref:coronin-7 n=1 Tax=Bacillus rossius redtenbacheri TaxID=93214 RepID=UPI002FDE9F4D